VNVSIFGLGYVGAVSYGCLVRQGHDVWGVDVDPGKLDLLRRGISPIVEEGMADLIQEASSSGRGHVTDTAAEAIAATDVSFVCVGTPSRRNGSHDLNALIRVCEEIGDAIRSKDTPHLVVIRSTVAPGTTEERLVPILVERSGRPLGRGLDVCFQPEFLREGTSIRDFENPPMTIVGGSPEACEVLRPVYEGLPCELFVTELRTAEMVKFCCNAFHALKVTFANEVGRLCQGLGIDGQQVMSLLCEDTVLNVSTAYLRPGFAFGGSCLPKDLRALVNMSREVAVDLPVLSGVLPSNESQVAHALQMVMSTGATRIGMVGLSFKGGTDDLRESPLLELAERLIGKGKSVVIYDSEVNLSRLVGANRAFLEGSIPHIASIMVETPEDLLADSEVIVFGSRNQAMERLLETGDAREKAVVDLAGLPAHLRTGRAYSGICW
jgi:GDP-mannose 6-dehydrogenase